MTPEARKAYNQAYYLKNRERLRARMAAYREDNKERITAKNAEYRRTNPDKCKAANARWMARNPKQSTRWYREHPGAGSEHVRRRDAMKLKATPVWADRQMILAKYAEAKRLTQATGIEWHVDHIVPLKSRLVCGLHVEHNLQVIPATENLKKKNLFWPDMPVTSADHSVSQMR